MKISHLSQIFNLRKIKRCQPHSVVDGCRGQLVKERDIRHQKDPVSLRNTFLHTKINTSIAPYTDSVDSKSYSRHPWCAERSSDIPQ